MSDEKKHEGSEKAAECIFKSVQYYCIGNIDEKVEKLLNERGAKKDSYLSQMVTHVIADDDSNDEFSEAKELFELPVVTSHWVILSAKCNTLLPLNAFNPETQQLFSGVVACPSRLSKDDSNALWAMLTFHGGRCRLDLNKKVTHLVTTRPEGDKYDCAITHESIKVVTPDWIIDCINAKQRVEETKYHPRLLILTPPKLPTPPPPPKPPTPVASPPKPVVAEPPKAPQQIPPHPLMQIGTPRLMMPGQGQHVRARYQTPPRMEHPMMNMPPRGHPQFAEMNQSIAKTMGMPPRPDNVAREALARMVNSRIQHTGNRGGESPSSMGMLQRMQVPMPQQAGTGPHEGTMPHQFGHMPPHMVGPNMSGPNMGNPNMGGPNMGGAGPNMGGPNMVGPNMGGAGPNMGGPNMGGPTAGGPNAAPRGMMPVNQRHPQFPFGNMHQHQQQQRPPHPGFMPHGNFPPGGMPPRGMQPMPMNMPPGIPAPQRGLSPGATAMPPSGKVSPRGSGSGGSPARSGTPTGTPKTSRNNSRSSTPTGGRTLRNITNGAEEAFPPNKQNTKIQQIMSSITRSPRSTTRPNQYQSRLSEDPRYYGHDEVDRVPGELCLLGCIFYITDYPKTLNREELDMWQSVIEQHGGIVDPSYSNRVTHILCEHQKSDVYQMAIRDNKRVVTAFWLNDVLLQKKMVPPWQALHFPSLYTDFKPGKDQIIAVSGYEHEDRTKIKQMINLIGAKYTGYMTRANTVLVCKKAEGVKYQKANEWRIPIVNTRWLSDIASGELAALKLKIPLKYQMLPLGDEEFKVDPAQVQPWLHGWRVPVKVPKESWKKFTPSTVKNNTTDNESNKRKSPSDVEEPNQEAKKARLVAEAELDTIGMSEFPSPKVLFTGLTKNESDKYLEIIRKLGGDLAASSSECTHLVTNCVSRTVKFLTCISCCRYIVSADWAEDCGKKGRFLNEERYVLNDKKSEADFSCSIKESLARAATKKLFQDFKFYVTPGVQPSQSVMKEVIENAGGRYVKTMPAARTVANTKNYIIISTENDIHLCKDYFKKKTGVYNAEFVLSGVLRQEVDYDSYRLEKT